MEEKEKMKILTQEEFDKEIVRALENDKVFIEFMNYVVKNICINGDNFATKTTISFYFYNCRIESIRISSVVKRLFISNIFFSNCIVEDYEKVESIGKYSITYCTFIKPVPLVCQAEGEFVGYKQCKYYGKNGYYDDCIVKLLIPADAKRSSAFGRKCRCSKAKVLGVYNRYGNKIKKYYDVLSTYDMGFYYKVGEWVYPDSFDDDRFNECSNGIHFFMTFEEARDY